jgi:hypothetical protein
MSSARTAKPTGVKMVADIRVYADPRLKDAAGERADKEGLPLSELVVKALATYLDRLDLAAVPRKRPGRRRKQAVQPTSM